MKKITKRNVDRKHLALRREVVVVLTQGDLTQVAGGEVVNGCTCYSSCRPSVDG